MRRECLNQGVVEDTTTGQKREERNEVGKENAPRLQLQHRVPPLFRNPGQEFRTEPDNLCRPFSATVQIVPHKHQKASLRACSGPKSAV